MSHESMISIISVYQYTVYSISVSIYSVVLNYKLYKLYMCFNDRISATPLSSFQ